VGGEEGGDKATEIIEGTGPALIACGCKADTAALRSVMYLVLGDKQPTGVVGVELAGSGTSIAMPPKTAWRDAAANVVEGATVRFAIE
jgi:hypothetical protein